MAMRNSYSRKFSGAAYLASLLLVLAVTPVVCIFRTTVVLLAKWLRPDFDKVVCGLSTMYLSDLLGTKSTPPRSNVVVTSIFKNQLSHEKVKRKVQERWIDGRENRKIYKKFQQYPVKWLGFCFWKNAFHTFSIDNHVHKLFGKETLVTEDVLNQAIENLLNTRLPPGQSPWEFHVIESYLPSSSSDAASDKHSQVQSVTLLRFHHALADGFSVTRATVKLFDKQFHSELKLPQQIYSSSGGVSSSWRSNFYNNLMFPVTAFIECFLVLSNLFASCPWRVPDSHKKWRQLAVRTPLIPIDRIKNIKNRFGVSFTSVLLSAISAAIYKSLRNDKMLCSANKGKIGVDNRRKSVLCMSVLPIIQRASDDALTNQLAAAFLDIPARHFVTPLERLLAVDRMLKRKKSSAFPYVSQILPRWVGAHILPVVSYLFDNKFVPFALSNNPGMPCNFEIDGNPLIGNEVQLGGAPGVTGVTVTAMSHGHNLRIAASIEEGLMSREQAHQFLKWLTDEILLLQITANSAASINNQKLFSTAS